MRRTVVDEPVGASRETVCFSSDSDGGDFGWIEPGDTEPADAEAGVVDL